VAKTRTRALQLLDGIWNFVGGTRGLSEYDLAGAIQPVSDLGRISEIGSGYSRAEGFFSGGALLTAVGAGTQRANFQPQDNIDFHNKLLSGSWMWLLNYSVMTNTAAAHTNSSALMQIIAEAGSFGAQDKLLYGLTGVINTSIRGALPDLPVTFGANGWEARFPMYVPRGSTIFFATDFSAAATANHFFLLWAGPRGARPPGVA